MGMSIIDTIRINNYRITKDEEADRMHQSCDGKWVKRDGKFGVFFGCSKFPACRATKEYEPDWDDHAV